MRRFFSKTWLYCGLLVLLVALTACSAMQGGGADPSPTAEPLKPLTIDSQSTSVEGRLVPKDSVQLAFSNGGLVEAVLVAEGDQVKVGDIIARLSGKEQLQSSIAAAEFELFTTQQARKALEDDLELQQNQALQALNQARQAVYDTERRVKGLGGTPNASDVELAKTQVVFAKNALERAEDDYKPFANRPENDLARARLQIVLSNAQKAYDSAVRNLNRFTGAVNDFDLNQAQTDLLIAQGQLTLAQEKVDTLEKGPDPDELAAVEARIQAAEARLKAAQSELVKLDLIATLAGKIVQLNLKPGQAVSPGVPVIEVVDFSEWIVETENLTEIEVVDVSVGQQVTVIPDSLPDLKLDGEVIAISDTFAEKRGEITYAVQIELKEDDPRLRWGMTVVVEFIKAPGD